MLLPGDRPRAQRTNFGSGYRPSFGTTPAAPLFGSPGIGTIAQGVQSIIADHPTWMIYARIDRRFPHLACYSPEAKSSVRGCPECLGTGYNLQLETHPVRISIKATATGPFSTGPGYLNNYIVTIYSDTNHIPAERDIFFDVEWDVSVSEVPISGRPVRVVHAYEIMMVADIMESGISYFASGCTPYEFELPLLENTILTHKSL